jgi:3-phenylpropionate/trans-cinnamate dioxygenase ferredoxin reductase subunit
VLARVAGEPISHFYEAEHRAHGVELRLGATVAALDGEERVTAVRLADGERIAADLVVVGIGIEAAVEPLLAAARRAATASTSTLSAGPRFPDVYAVGDCAAHENPWADGRRLRLESVQNATDMGSCAARAIAGTPEPYAAMPWFWSNQYDLRLQTVGLSSATTRPSCGDPATRSFSVLYGSKQGRVIALDCVNATRDYVQGRAAGVAQWQSRSFPSLRRGFDSLHPLQPTRIPKYWYGRCLRFTSVHWLFGNG